MSLELEKLPHENVAGEGVSLEMSLSKSVVRNTCPELLIRFMLPFYLLLIFGTRVILFPQLPREI